MKARRRHRRHAIRVAAVATLVVMVFYVVAAITLNLVVTSHLIGTTDNRLDDRLKDARQQTLTLPGSKTIKSDTDLEDSPQFLWSITSAGTVTALTPTAPPLPRRHWGSGPLTLALGHSQFPVQYAACAWLVARRRSEHGIDFERPVSAPGRRAPLRRDPGRCRVRRCDDCRPAGVSAVRAHQAPAGRVHGRCLA